MPRLSCTSLSFSLGVKLKASIVEMSDFGFAGCLLGPIAFIPMSWVFAPRLKPSVLVLIFTYLIPLIPLMFFWDALISAWRTYAPHHILHLSKQAEANVNKEIKDRALASTSQDEQAGTVAQGDQEEEIQWEWEFGREVHTRPSAVMIWAVGKRVRN